MSDTYNGFLGKRLYVATSAVTFLVSNKGLTALVRRPFVWSESHFGTAVAQSSAGPPRCAGAELAAAGTDDGAGWPATDGGE